jgi:hypothetical protein
MKHSDLQHRVKTLTKHGKSAEAQAILGPLGYTPAALDQAREKLLNLNALRRQTKDLLAAKKKAGEIEDEAHIEARNITTKFKRTGRRMFKKNKPALTQIGLYPPLWSTVKKSTNGAVNGETETEPDNGSRYVRRPSFSTSAKIDRWLMLFGNALELPEEERAQLAERGWTTERLTEALGLVEAYAEADIDQKEKEKAYDDAVTASSAAAEALEDWYLAARGYILAEIADLPRKKQASIKKLLGL